MQCSGWLRRSKKATAVHGNSTNGASNNWISQLSCMMPTAHCQDNQSVVSFRQHLFIDLSILVAMQKQLKTSIIQKHIKWWLLYTELNLYIVPSQWKKVKKLVDAVIWRARRFLSKKLHPGEQLGRSITGCAAWSKCKWWMIIISALGSAFQKVPICTLVWPKKNVSFLVYRGNPPPSWRCS